MAKKREAAETERQGTLQEGRVQKGNVNDMPTNPPPEDLRPAPPLPQEQGQETPVRVEDAVELHLAPNSVLLVRSGSRPVEQQVIRINRGFRRQGIAHQLLVVPNDTKIEQLDEAKMNRHGWYRQDEE